MHCLKPYTYHLDPVLIYTIGLKLRCEPKMKCSKSKDTELLKCLDKSMIINSFLENNTEKIYASINFEGTSSTNYCKLSAFKNYVSIIEKYDRSHVCVVASLIDPQRGNCYIYNMCTCFTPKMYGSGTGVGFNPELKGILGVAILKSS